MIKNLLYIMFVLPLITYAFPNGRCYVPSCEATPYDLIWVSETPLSNGNTYACFEITNKPCIDPSNYACCNTFLKSLYKIVLSSPSTCVHSVINVKVNGIQRGGGVYFDTVPEGQLRITNLNIPYASTNGTRICLTLSPPCNSIFDFCVDSRSQLCKFSFWDNSNPMCCPTCIMLDKSQSTNQGEILYPPPNTVSPQQPSVPQVPSISSPPPLQPQTQCRLFTTSLSLIPSVSNTCSECFFECNYNNDCAFYSWNNSVNLEWDDDVFCTIDNVIQPPIVNSPPIPSQLTQECIQCMEHCA